MTNFQIKRGERLKSKKTIDSLFSGANSVSKYPLLLLWKEVDLKSKKESFPIQFTVSVAKKKYKNAVDRNFVKRHIREAYRLNKPNLYENLTGDNRQFAFMFIFTGKQLEDCSRIKWAMRKVLEKFLEQKENKR
ncbi:MAG: ribonuclease P protein component [Bacteroidetes bacterium]|nr:MAG: ribonuclease P protein component [Bacteroidota bacterium]